MTFVLREEFELFGGQEFFISSVWFGNQNILIRNTNYSDDESRLWGIFYLNIYVPNPIDETADIVKRELFTRNTLMFEPFPSFTSLNVGGWIYVPYSVISALIQVYIE